MSYYLEFELPILPAMTNRKQKHWRVVRAEETKLKRMVGMFVSGEKRPSFPLKRAKLVLTRFSARSPDPDGLVSGFKNVIDGLVEAGVLENDRYENISMPEYKWVKTPQKSGKIRVEVYSVVEEKGEG